MSLRNVLDGVIKIGRGDSIGPNGDEEEECNTLTTAQGAAYLSSDAITT